MRVLAVDPGGETGFACWKQTPGGESIQQWQIVDQLQVLATVRDELATTDVLVVESFTIGGSRASDSNKTIEIIGGCRWLASLAGVPMVEQSPADAVMFATNDKLKRIGWWKVGEDHSRSATRHLLLYLTKAKLIDARRLLSDA